MKPFFVIRSFCTNFSSSFYVISLAWKVSFCLSANHNLELLCVICTGVTLFALVLHLLNWCYTFCTGVTPFALVLHLNCTALSQSETSNFMHIIKLLNNVNCSNSKFSLPAGENAGFECGNQAWCRQFILMLFQHCKT